MNFYNFLKYRNIVELEMEITRVGDRDGHYSNYNSLIKQDRFPAKSKCDVNYYTRAINGVEETNNLLNDSKRPEWTVELLVTAPQ
ncbi:hypothetical protein J6590_010404 [Homalodisca vitripennis]|nr:hypothetical protein J6590_010404 [Homalodisca vitripennis]